MPPGVYLHVPFCAKVCPYCDFAVLVGDQERRESFVASLVAEIELCGAIDQPELTAFDTIYLGGGTPSMLERGQLERVLSTLRERLDVAPGAAIFLEANPEDVTRERLGDWIDLGVHTLSLGVQSFDDRELRFLGRQHDSSRAVDAVELAVEAGVATVSLDLIYGLPGQGESAWRKNLERAIELGPDHLSCYELTIHRAPLSGCAAGAVSWSRCRTTTRPPASSSPIVCSPIAAIRATRSRTSRAPRSTARATT